MFITVMPLRVWFNYGFTIGFGVFMRLTRVIDGGVRIFVNVDLWICLSYFYLIICGLKLINSNIYVYSISIF